MKTLSRFRSWLRTLFHRSRMERDMDQELRFHVEQYTADLVRGGMAPAEASRRAHVEFGSVETHKEEMRQALGLRLLDELSGDLRYTFRQLRQSPAFAAVAVLSLALGIGANTAIVSLMEAALWKAIPVRSPEQLRLLSWVSGPRLVMDGINGNISRTPSGGSTSTSFSYPVFLELQRENQVFDTLFGFKPVQRVTAVIDGQAELLAGELVSGHFYDGLGILPAAGRSIGPADDIRGVTDTVAVISDGYWTRRFGRDSSVLGKRIDINQIPVTIIGINPPAFVGVEPGQNPDIFLPLTSQPAAFLQRLGDGSLLDNPDTWWVLVMGRLKPGVSESQAEAVLSGVFQAVVRSSLPDRADRDQPQLKMLSGARGLDNLDYYKKSLFVLLSLVGVVLLIACANVANLLLARAAARQREISLRLALGADRWRIARQLLTEGLALALTGGASGVLLGYWLRDSIPSLLATSWSPSPFRAAFDGPVLATSIALTVATGVLFSLAPAWQSARMEISTALKDAGHAVLRLPRWTRGKPLVVLQVSLAVLLLVGAGLFIRTLSNLRSATLGFRPERILLFAVDPPSPRYVDETRRAIYSQLEQQIGAIPGVEAVALSAEALVTQSSGTTRVGPNGRQPEAQDIAWVNDVAGGFFETMGIPMLDGRSFGPQDRENSPPVAVVSQQFANRFFPHENALGQTFRNGNRLFEIIGIAGDTRYDRVRTPFPPTFYRSYLQAPRFGTLTFTFEVRSAVNEPALVKSIRAVVRPIDPDLPVFDIRTQTEQIDATFSQDRLFVALTMAFGVLALVLACIGIYGLMANGVARRTNEIAIRIALGAQRGRVLVMILREAALLAAMGATIGVAVASGLTRYIESMLYGVVPLDPVTMVSAVIVMLLVALLAGWIPARRASRLDPMVALRHE